MILHVARFAGMTRWSANGFAFDQLRTRYPPAPLSRLLRRVKEPVAVEDEQLYQRVTVRLYGKGVFQRDEVYGRDIGTKKQFAVHAGQLIVSRIDARNGAFGMVPRELEGAIVTNDFWLFEVEGVQPRYLTLVLSSEPFQRHWQAQSSGTTNRQRVNENDFLTSEVILPEEEEQRRILEAYQRLAEQARRAREDAGRQEEALDRALRRALGIRSRAPVKRESLLRTAAFKEIRQWGFDKIMIPFPYVFERYEAHSFYTKPSWLEEIYRGKSPRYSGEGSTVILNQKCNRVDQIDLSYAKRVDRAWADAVEKKYLTRPGDILINSTGEGTLGRASLVTEASAGFLYDSHMLLLRVNKREVHPQLLVDLINSSFGRKQVELYKSAQATKQTELGVENTKKLLFPLPELAVQNEIAADMRERKDRIRALRREAERLERQAEKEFEEAVFDGE